MLRALAFVPTDDVVAVYLELLLHIDDVALAGLLDYLETWYIGSVDRFGQRGNGRFGREIWNVYQRSIDGISIFLIFYPVVWPDYH
jgi:hypothetical protein